MILTNRELIAVHVLFRATILFALVAALIWGFVVRIIDGEAFLGFVALILSVIREMRLPFFDEEPRLTTAPPSTGTH